MQRARSSPWSRRPRLTPPIVATSAIRCGSGRNARRPSRTATAGTPTERASAAAASAFATLCGAAGTTSATDASSAAEVCRSATKARSTSSPSTTPSMPAPGTPKVNPIARAPSHDVGRPNQPFGLGVLDVVDAGDLDTGVDAALVGRVVLERAVPVEVVGCDVEQGGGARRHRVRPVQLIARQLERDDVVRLRVEHGLDDRVADVAGRGDPQSGRPQHLGQHPHRRGLAVGTGHGEPGRGPLRVAQPPGQLDLPPDRDPGPPAAATSSGAVGRQPGEVTTSRRRRERSRVTPGPRRTVAPRISSTLARSFSASPSRSSTTVTIAPEPEQCVGSGEPGHADAGDHDALSADHCSSVPRPTSHGRHGHAPTTHSA